MVDDLDHLAYHRFLLRDTIRKQIDFRLTDQRCGVPAPPVEKPCPEGATRIPLPRPDWTGVGSIDLATAIGRRRSRRTFRNDPLTLTETAFLLWATQGLREGPDRPSFRTVPSAGARHPFETYLCVLDVTALDVGIYRYLPLSHELVLLHGEPDLGRRLGDACFGQSFVGRSAVTLVWTALPYRTEWRYGLAAHKVIAIDVGHIGQNLYLACEAIGAGTCAIGAYDQEEMDALLRVDGVDEQTIYLAPVGKV